jgi:hypothetical protein
MLIALGAETVIMNPENRGHYAWRKTKKVLIGGFDASISA